MSRPRFTMVDRVLFLFALAYPALIIRGVWRDLYASCGSFSGSRLGDVPVRCIDEIAPRRCP